MREKGQNYFAFEFNQVSLLGCVELNFDFTLASNGYSSSGGIKVPSTTNFDRDLLWNWPGFMMKLSSFGKNVPMSRILSTGYRMSME